MVGGRMADHLIVTLRLTVYRPQTQYYPHNIPNPINYIKWVHYKYLYWVLLKNTWSVFEHFPETTMYFYLSQWKSTCIYI